MVEERNKDMVGIFMCQSYRECFSLFRFPFPTSLLYRPIIYTGIISFSTGGVRNGSMILYCTKIHCKGTVVAALESRTFSSKGTNVGSWRKYQSA